MKRNILLIEPNYKNKYPPIGLMKIASYHKQLGDNVKFFKGDLKEFVIDSIFEELVVKLENIDNTIKWNSYREDITTYIKRGTTNLLNDLTSSSNGQSPILKEWFKYYFNFYRNKKFQEKPKWDRVYVSTLFTFHWKITIETINFAKYLVKDISELKVGGVLASVLSKEVKNETGIKTIQGLLDKPGILDNNEIVVDTLPLDYSILEEIDYKYPENNAYYGYMTRGCVRKCEFCVVWRLEPKYEKYVPLKDKISDTSKVYGEKRNLLLLDNNALASKDFSKIIDEIKSNGFYKGAKFKDPNYLAISIRNLKKGINDSAYRRKSFDLYHKLLEKARGNDKQEVYDILDEYQLLSFFKAEKHNLINAYKHLKVINEKYLNKVEKLRYVDFNQGLDARLMSEDKMKKLSEIPIRPLRIAFDSMDYQDVYERSIRWAAKYKIPECSNYLLYNFNDKPEELYQRLEINVKLCDELKMAIFSFPMKYLPIDNDKFYMNRNYIGPNWNRKYLRAIQAILNSTKGKVGRGYSFFKKAFGKDLDEFFELLYMPETYLIYRYFFEHIGFINEWKKDFSSEFLSHTELAEAKEIIEQNDFTNIKSLSINKRILKLLKHYDINKQDFLYNAESELYKLKKQYDESGILEKDINDFKASLLK
jgi:hypothetical protein